jgi:hypothetical protein
MTADTPELLPCPFCGGDGRACIRGEVYTIECDTCRVSTNGCSSREVAVELWNHREGEQGR